MMLMRLLTEGSTAFPFLIRLRMPAPGQIYDLGGDSNVRKNAVVRGTVKVTICKMLERIPWDCLLPRRFLSRRHFVLLNVPPVLILRSQRVLGYAILPWDPTFHNILLRSSISPVTTCLTWSYQLILTPSLPPLTQQYIIVQLPLSLVNHRRNTVTDSWVDKFPRLCFLVDLFHEYSDRDPEAAQNIG